MGDSEGWLYEVGEWKCHCTLVLKSCNVRIILLQDCMQLIFPHDEDKCKINSSDATHCFDPYKHIEWSNGGGYYVYEFLSN